MDTPTAEALDALEFLLRELRQFEGTLPRIHERAGYLRDSIASGARWSELLAGVPSECLIANDINESLVALHEAAADLRRAQMRALHADGMSMDRIADVFGVTRQRVSMVLKTG